MISLAVFAAVGVSAVSFVLIVTADARLDLNKLKGSPSPLVVLSNSKNVISKSTLSTQNSTLAEHTKNAFIAVEDKRFYSHNGIDYKRIAGAVVADLKTKSKAQGASTITQQLVKNTHLSSEKTIERKLKEMKIAMQLEKKMSKDEILTTYLDKIYFGNGCIGIEAASNFYFNKSASSLDLAESALLAGLVKAPSATEPKAHYEKAIERRNLVLKLMKQQSLITDDQFENAVNSKPNLVFKTGQQKSFELYTKMAKDEAAQILGIDLDTLEKSAFVIETFLDENVQGIVLEQARNGNFLPSGTNGPVGSLASIAIDNKTGAVRAFYSVGSFDFKSGKRQPASCLKPILVYAPAIEDKKISPQSFLLDAKTNFGDYSPSNAGGQYSGWISAETALAKSKNIPAIKLLEIEGVERAKSFATKAGIEFEEADNSLALALGGMTNGVTLCQLAGAYTTFENGVFKQPSFVKSIKNQNGQTLYLHSPQTTRVFDTKTAYLTTTMLQKAVENGTSKDLGGLGFEVAAKTGTVGTKTGNTDCFSVAYTSDLVLGTMITSGGEEFAQNINGATVPTRFNRAVLGRVYSTSKPNDFDVPAGIEEVKLDSRALVQNKLMLLDENSDQKFAVLALFDTNNKPTEVFLPSDVATENQKNEHKTGGTKWISLVDFQKYKLPSKNSQQSPDLNSILDELFGI